jgi:CrcB protein
METLAKFGWIFLGGGVGSCFRYALGTLIQSKTSGAFPWGTLCVNVLGAFCIGWVLSALGSGGAPHQPTVRLLVAVGFLGGFTTFSTLAFESLELLQAGRSLDFALYVFGTNLLGLLACAFGVWVANAMGFGS